MWTYSAISITVTAVVLAAGLLGFAGGWLTSRAASARRIRALEAELEDLTRR